MATFLTYLLGLLVVGGALFLIASFAFGRGEELAAMPPDGTPVELPDDRPVLGADVRELRLSVVLRGYRMEEVDWVLAELAEQLDERDREIARLLAAAPDLEPEIGRPAPAGPIDPADTISSAGSAGPGRSAGSAGAVGSGRSAGPVGTAGSVGEPVIVRQSGQGGTVVARQAGAAGTAGAAAGPAVPPADEPADDGRDD